MKFCSVTRELCLDAKCSINRGTADECRHDGKTRKLFEMSRCPKKKHNAPLGELSEEDKKQ